MIYYRYNVIPENLPVTASGQVDRLLCLGLIREMGFDMSHVVLILSKGSSACCPPY